WYGLTLTQLGRFPEALDSLQRALQLDPFSIAIQSHIGRLSYFQRDFKLAISQLERACELDSSYFPARYFLSMAKLQSGRVAEAVSEFESLVAESKGHP